LFVCDCKGTTIFETDQIFFTFSLQFFLSRSVLVVLQWV
jgi:hypothetical protein